MAVPDQIALSAIATELAQLFELGLGVDAVGDHTESERVPELDERANDRRVLVGLSERLDEALVDLDQVDRQLSQTREGRRARPEVAERQPHAGRLERAQRRRDRFGILADGALGHLEADRAGVDLGGADRVAQQRRQARVAKLPRREGQRQPHVGPVRAPGPELDERVLEREAADRDRHAGVLGQRHELRGTEQAAAGMLPVDLRVDPAHVGERVQGDPRLVVEAKLAALDRFADRALELDPGDRAAPRLLVEQLEPRAAALLGAVHRGVGLPDHGVRRDRRVGHHRDPDADRDRQLDAVDVDRRARGLADAVGDQHDLALGRRGPRTGT